MLLAFEMLAVVLLSTLLKSKANSEFGLAKAFAWALGAVTTEIADSVETAKTKGINEAT